MAPKNAHKQPNGTHVVTVEHTLNGVTLRCKVVGQRKACMKIDFDPNPDQALLDAIAEHDKEHGVKTLT